MTVEGELKRLLPVSQELNVKKCSETMLKSRGGLESDQQVIWKIKFRCCNRRSSSLSHSKIFFFFCVLFFFSYNSFACWMASSFGQDLKICPSAFSKYAGTTRHKGCFSLYQQHKSCISISAAPSLRTIYFLPCLLNLNAVLAGGKFSKLRMPFKQRQCTKWRKRSFFQRDHNQHGTILA